MKKNITINLFGALYNIDEDAYNLLSRYQKDMKRYFARRDGGEEIADDIEHRVAELMAELKASGIEAITIEHIETIIRRIGNPEQLEVDGESEYATQQEKPRKKLFRNPDDKKLGGVLSGIAVYFGIDAMILRLIVLVLLFFFHVIPVCLYLLCWMAIPLAKTPEDKLRMRGEPVNIENMREEILNGVERVGDFARSPKTESKLRGCLSTKVNLVAGAFKGIIYIGMGGAVVALVIALLFLVFGIGMALYVSVAGFDSLLFGDVEPVIAHTLEQLPLMVHFGFWVSAFSLLAMLVIPLFGFIHWFNRLSGRGAEMSAKMRTSLVVSWLAALVLFSVFTTITSITVVKKYHEAERVVYTINGFYVPKEDYDCLTQDGWNVIAHKNCFDQYVRWGYYYNDDNGFYLEGIKDEGVMQYQLEKTETVTPGVYQLEAVGRTNGEGAFIYAQIDSIVYKQEIPAFGSERGGIWDEAKQRIEAGGLSETDSISLNEIYQRNNGKGYGWSRVVVENIVVTEPGELKYGVSNVPSFTGSPWRGSRLSATSFKLTCLKTK